MWDGKGIMSQASIENYVASLSIKRKTGQAGEHAYRAVFEELIRQLDESLRTVNDPKRSEYGAPDFVFLRGDLTVGYAETKDIDANLDKVEKSEQMERYFGYSNLILTNYLEFRFFKNGERHGEPIIIGELTGEQIQSNPDHFGELADTLRDFLTEYTEPIKSGEKLAKIMGGKARRIRDNVASFLQNKEDLEQNKDIQAVYQTIKRLLVADLSIDNFADMYAQTLVYGLFAARFYDESQDTFSREEARELVPASNPFLRHFFDHIAGPNFDKRLVYIVNELCEVFQNADVRALMEQYYRRKSNGNGKKGPDPVIHFYEDFLNEYDPVLRRKMGAYYTPLPVVQFIVDATDKILRSEFGLSEGLADTSKLENGLHKVQVLDPAVGTGTFISTIIRNIYKHILKNGQEGRWPTYVHNDLLPRLHGFELMMASYTIAHLKLSIAFRETGFKYFNRRLGIYLTNSLEPTLAQGNLFANFGFAQSITEESKEAAKIKNETPIMVVTGNPPYSVSSQNKGEWIQDLIKVYKEGLGEKKINLDDDYIKFIRFAEHFIERTGYGIVAMITNNSFIDGITHRQMRKHLLETFDSIYVLDLHGNAKKKEKAPDGGKDENVFNIQQGVAISIFIRKSKEKSGLGEVHHADLYGEQETKFEVLEKTPFDKIEWAKVDYTEPYYFFVPKDFGAEQEYLSGFRLDDLFYINSSGIETQKDNIAIHFDRQILEKIVHDFETLKESELATKYNLGARSLKKIREVIDDVSSVSGEYIQILYRPFDKRWTYYTGKAVGLMARPRDEVMRHFVHGENVGLQVSRQQSTYDFQHALVSDRVVDRNSISMQTREATYFFPLYLYAENGSRIPNLKKEIIEEIESIVGKTTPEDIFDYVYAILHSPDYREKYKEFLKIDFPRVPYSKEKKQFQEIVKLGRELRELHLLESTKLNKLITTYPEAGDNVVEKIEYKDGNVYINQKQYFGNVPELAWNFYIGGYQPAQKWLKDRKGRILSNEDIVHYQKIIIVLTETDRLMKEIDRITEID